MLIASYLNRTLFVQIRRKMREIMTNQASSCDLKELVRKFIPEMIGKEIEKATCGIYPLQNVFIRKVKILKAPKFDLGKLMEVLFFERILLYFSLPYLVALSLDFMFGDTDCLIAYVLLFFLLFFIRFCFKLNDSLTLQINMS